MPRRHRLARGDEPRPERGAGEGSPACLQQARAQPIPPQAGGTIRRGDKMTLNLGDPGIDQDIPGLQQQDRPTARQRRRLAPAGLATTTRDKAGADRFRDRRDFWIRTGRTTDDRVAHQPAHHAGNDRFQSEAERQSAAIRNTDENRQHAVTIAEPRAEASGL